MRIQSLDHSFYRGVYELILINILIIIPFDKRDNRGELLERKIPYIPLLGRNKPYKTDQKEKDAESLFHLKRPLHTIKASGDCKVRLTSADISFNNDWFYRTGDTVSSRSAGSGSAEVRLYCDCLTREEDFTSWLLLKTKPDPAWSEHERGLTMTGHILYFSDSENSDASLTSYILRAIFPDAFSDR